MRPTECKVKLANAVALVGEDGSREQVGFFDTKTDQECRFDSASDGVPRCLPDGTILAEIEYNHFQDAACSTAIVIADVSDSCGRSYTTRLLPAGGDKCQPRQLEVQRLSSTVVTPYFVDPFDSVCKIDPGASSPAFLVEVVAPTEFVAATEQLE